MAHRRGDAAGEGDNRQFAADETGIEANGFDHFIGRAAFTVEIDDEHVEWGDSHISEELGLALEGADAQTRIAGQNHGQH
ncbi:hypothetical protein D3C87_1770690 [compost metagenome]